MKFFFTILFILSLNSYSKEKKNNDKLLINLRGMGCQINPSIEDINYNIKYLESIQSTDSNNIFAYRHCATQYYYLFAIEEDSIIKENFRQKALKNNIRVLDLFDRNKALKNATLYNIVLLYALGNECQNVKLYYSFIKKRDFKFFDKGTFDYIVKLCGL